MTDATLRLDIVSAEKQIFSGEVKAVLVTGEEGELGIEPGHSQLLTYLKPGHIHAILPNGNEELFYVSGGILEVQPYIASVLSNTAVRAADIDEAAAIAAKEQAERALAGQLSAIDMARATAELAEVTAQIDTIRRLKKRAGAK